MKSFYVFVCNFLLPICCQNWPLLKIFTSVLIYPIHFVHCWTPVYTFALA